MCVLCVCEREGGRQGDREAEGVGETEREVGRGGERERER